MEKTVGKTYMACAGLKDCEVEMEINEPHPIKRLLRLAFEMMKFIKPYTYGNDAKSLMIKIGIHTGPVIAGVIGHHKPQFSLIGDTINTTSRLCSAKEINPGKIVISSSCYEQIKGSSGLVFSHKTIEVFLIFIKIIYTYMHFF